MRIDVSDSELGLYEVRRERVFLVLAGIFLCAMTLLNVLGITRFVQVGWMTVAIGVLPYPITFLCTDLICELYGRKRANFLVTVGLGLNFFILLVLIVAEAMPAPAAGVQPPWQVLSLAAPVMMPDGEMLSGDVELFTMIYSTTVGAVFASMMAYMAAQYCDVQLFHFWKRLTRGRYLWIRNNFSTLLSQFVDATMVISVTFGAALLAGEIAAATFVSLIVGNYTFKMLVALADTGPFYLGVHYLSRYLGVEKAAARKERGAAPAGPTTGEIHD